ncbi:YidC/Oxa1 family membrane protein insertase [Pontibacter ummariensis]|uniref:Membrane protein insertase YidC n=1 Tax=Pontibacter ummariensis TaxID=1610492 RepID=A0A239F9U5_9BACT|nr:membrane protein insertase YidC [Pontibacter ummariensis]PRY12360.1 YidC/Oxa1 family membrane protein insertase [Pontibacter ummariensis]SNS53575.1 YidC/Oxa1 family membrane protein insertase [Pontibacter ummariensis]
MDRNQAIGFGLIAVLLLAYSFFFAGTDKPVEQVAVQEKAKVEQLQSAVVAEDDSLVQARRVTALGAFGVAATGEAEVVTLENENMVVAFNTKGGQVEEVLLKNYKTYQGDPLVLFDNESSETNVAFKTTDGNVVQLSDLFFTPSAVEEVTEEGTAGKTIVFTAQLGNGQSINQIYTLYEENFLLGYKLEFKGLEREIAGDVLTFTWSDRLKQLERDIKQNRAKSTINYYVAEDGFESLSISEGTEAESVEAPLKWVANKQNFFTAGIIAGEEFAGAEMKSSVDLADSSVVKTLASQIYIPKENVFSGKGDFMFYFGPNDYTILKNIGFDFDDNLDLGWGIFSYVNKWLIIPAFDFLENYIGNYGIIIILLVLYIKTILFPLTYKSYVSMAKMKVLKPEIDAIKERNDGDMQKTQMETMKLYSEMGVSPLSGCIPMLLQIPILFAMFNFFPNSIELRQEAFLWAEDLSTYDVFARLPFTIPFYGDHVSLFTLLMTLSTILYTWSNNQVNTMQGPMKYYSYLMPLIFMFVLNSYPAGLSFYYFVSNIVTFTQQAAIRKFVDEGKVRAKLEENKHKIKEKKKKGGPSFSERMQEAMRQAAEKEQQKRKAKK